jgi:hypothetical protein
MSCRIMVFQANGGDFRSVCTHHVLGRGNGPGSGTQVSGRRLSPTFLISTKFVVFARTYVDRYRVLECNTVHGNCHSN